MKPAKIASILKIVRLHIVVGGVLAFSLGSLLAIVGGGYFDPIRFAWFYAIVLFGDLSTHYSNDYFDVKADRLVEKRKFFSGNNILVDNPRLLPTARLVSLAFMSLSVVLAVSAVIFHLAPIEVLLIALGANFLGWFYSAPPLRLVSRGLGELAVALAAGFGIPAMGYLAIRGQFDPWFAYFTIPFVLYGLMLSLSLEAPDVEVDRKVVKRNIGARKGERTVFGLILGAALAATLMLAFYAWKGTIAVMDLRWVVAFSTIPLASSLLACTNILRKRRADIFSALNVFSLFTFNVLMVAYLAIITSTA